MNEGEIIEQSIRIEEEAQRLAAEFKADFLAIAGNEIQPAAFLVRNKEQLETSIALKNIAKVCEESRSTPNK